MKLILISGTNGIDCSPLRSKRSLGAMRLGKRLMDMDTNEIQTDAPTQSYISEDSHQISSMQELLALLKQEQASATHQRILDIAKKIVSLYENEKSLIEKLSAYSQDDTRVTASWENHGDVNPGSLHKLSQR